MKMNFPNIPHTMLVLVNTIANHNPKIMRF